MSGERVLILGGPDAAKTTYQLQLYGRVRQGEGHLRLRGAVESLAAFSEGFRRLQQGLPARHTPHGTDAISALPIVDEAGREFDVTIPDYAGEDLRRVGETLRLPDRWRKYAAGSDHWILMIRLSRHPDIPDLVSRPVGELATVAYEPAGLDDATLLPVDMLSVELLQILRYGRLQAGADGPLRVTLALSCWDELQQPDGTLPRTVAAEHLALLNAYCAATWGSSYTVMGVSAQGRTLEDGEPDEEFIDAGAEAMGWLVDADGNRDPDLTKLLAVG